VGFNALVCCAKCCAATVDRGASPAPSRSEPRCLTAVGPASPETGIQTQGHLTTHEPVQAEPVVRTLSRWRLPAESLPPKSLQKRIVSSAEAEATVVPSGEAAICSTRCVWPVSSAALVIEGYFHTMSWLCENPWDETSSC